MAQRPDPDCPTCFGVGETPCAMSMTGTNDRPVRVSYGPCPTCRDGATCPRCYYQGGMDDDENGDPKCRYCGWSAEADRRFAKDIVAGVD